jgi:hypothetical protein
MAPIPETVSRFNSKWRHHFCIIPRRIRGRWYWLSTIACRFHQSPGGGHWEYGDLFDLLHN